MSKTPSTRGRGRPAKLSREQILSCALKMIERSPGQKITMTGVAKALNTAPMSLYTHVQHRDDLMDGIAERVMGNIDLQLDDKADWESRVREWLLRCHKHLSAYPQVISLLPQAERVPPSWLRVHAPLIATLHSAGFRGAALAAASQWVGHQLISALIIGFARHRRIAANSDVASLFDQLNENEQAIFREILPHIQPDDEFFPYTVEQIILALRGRLAAPA